MALPTMRSGLVSREFLRVAGGYGAPSLGTSPAGGLDIDNAGNIATDGDVSIKGVLSVGSTPLVLTNAAGLVDGEKIQDGTVDTTELADDAVTPAKMDATADFIMNTLQLGANVVKNADGETVITLDANQNTTLENDLYFNGGGSIGTNTDANLLELSDNVLNVNGSLGVGVAAPSDDVQIGGSWRSRIFGVGLFDGTGNAPYLGFNAFVTTNEGSDWDTVSSTYDGGVISLIPSTSDNATRFIFGFVDQATHVESTAMVIRKSGDVSVSGDLTVTGSLMVRSVTDAGPMTSTAGTVAEIVYNTSDSKFYGCTATGSPATWSALN